MCRGNRFSKVFFFLLCPTKDLSFLFRSNPIPCCTSAYYSVFQLYNLTVMDLGSKDVFCYVWDETEGAKCMKIIIS